MCRRTICTLFPLSRAIPMRIAKKHTRPHHRKHCACRSKTRPGLKDYAKNIALAACHTTTTSKTARHKKTSNNAWLLWRACFFLHHFAGLTPRQPKRIYPQHHATQLRNRATAESEKRNTKTILKRLKYCAWLLPKNSNAICIKHERPHIWKHCA